MPSNPRIYVSVITYNHGPYIRQCLESLVGQTLKPWRIAVFDDCSTDGTVDVVREYADRHGDLFKLHLQERNLGMVEHTKYIETHHAGDFFTRIEGDDWWDERKLDEEYKALCRNPRAVAAYCNVAATTADGVQGPPWQRPEAGPLPSGELLLPVALWKVFSHSGNLPRNYLLRLSMFDPMAKWYQLGELTSLGDVHRRMGLARRFEFEGVDCLDPLVFYRRHDAGVSRNRKDVINARAAIYEAHDADFASLPLQQEVVVRTWWETTICSDRGALQDPNKAKYFQPAKVLARAKAMFTRLPAAQRRETWQMTIWSLRAATAMYVGQLAFNGYHAETIGLWEAHLKHEPMLPEAVLVFPPETYAALRRELQARLTPPGATQPPVWEQIDTMRPRLQSLLDAKKVCEAINLWQASLPRPHVRTCQAAFSLVPDIHAQIYAQIEKCEPAPMRQHLYERSHILGLLDKVTLRQSA
ncbi:MAG: glycosyltransferase family 2 protein [Phycisphaerae bacterium]|nr:glycosyltransferase family 2 protein [Phycisphaerae bacterium]